MKLKVEKKSGLKYFDIKDIRSWKPCYDPNKHLKEDFKGTAIDILKNEDIPFLDRLWVCLRTDLISEKLMRLFAVWSYRQTLKFFENPDPISINTANVAERFANGKASAEELSAARAASWSAHSAARSAARAASWSAHSAAHSDAWSAAWSAAESASWSAHSASWSDAWSARSVARAAWSSAESAARAASWSAHSAARSAAWSAYYDARAAAESAQRDKLIEMIETEAKENRK